MLPFQRPIASTEYLPTDPGVVLFWLTKVRAVTLVEHLKSIVKRSCNEATNSDEVMFTCKYFIATVHAHTCTCNKTAHIAVCVCFYLSEIGICGDCISTGIENGEI